LSINILIVDDSTVERNYLAALLGKLGIVPELADCCDEGVRLACGEKFDLMFIDYFMPEADGVHTLHEIRMTEKSMNTETPAIALGRSDTDSDSDFFCEHGFLNYIEKPVNPEFLHAALILYLPAEKRSEVGTSQQTGSGKNDETLPGWLKELPELSIRDGIKNCGNEEDYLAALKIFYGSIDAHADEIQGYYDNGNLKDYTIKVHALKSSARIIGLSELSELAKQLEAAGDSGDLDRIEQDTGRLLEWYRSYRQKLSRLDECGGEEDNEDKPLADRDFLDDAFSSLDDFARQMDFNLVEMVIESVREYRLEGRDKELFDEADTAFMNIDWNGIRTVSKKYFSERASEAEQ